VPKTARCRGKKRRGEAMLELVEEHACCGGVQRTYKHDSQSIGLPMRFSVFLPAKASGT